MLMQTKKGLNDMVPLSTEKYWTILHSFILLISTYAEKMGVMSIF